MTSDPSIERIEATAYRIPTDAPEGDGTFEWDSTTMIVVKARAANLKEQDARRFALS